MVLHGHCHGYHLVLHQQGASWATHHLPRSYCMKSFFLDTFRDHTNKHLFLSLQCVLYSSCRVSSLPSCPRLSARSPWELISSSPICTYFFSPSSSNNRETSHANPIPTDGWLHSSSLLKITTGMTATPTLPQDSAAAGRRPTNLSSSLPCTFGFPGYMLRTVLIQK